ncbi:hypothetical protein N9H93_02065 [Rhizobiaceae bacterium]|nr:hypothetical protein [Rhizobiaceae bacterium]
MTNENTKPRHRAAALALGIVLLAGAGTTLAVAQSGPGERPTAGAHQEGSKARKASFRKRHERSGRRGGGGGMMRQLFAQADADKDGAVTREEIAALRQSQVQAADADGNGDLTLAEFERVWLSMNRSRMVDAFQRLDEDGSGEVTAAEIDEPLNRMVERMDRNGDGKIDREDRGRRGRDGGRGGRDRSDSSDD